ncbi:MAG: helix-turn-helix domain-containing protein [Actinobacteria bacterium]|nr:helix-turn-helix domain-containing protein [Actinomycetota bacterium]
MARSEGQERRCQGCGTRLARDNPSRLCSPCSRHEVQASSAPIKQDGFWERAVLRDALESRHFGQVLNAYRYEHRPVLTQAKVGRWLGLTQGQVSRLERTAQPTHDLNKLDHWARALHIPERYLWFQLSEQPARAYPRPRHAHSLDDEFETGGEDVQRRQLLRAAAAGAASVSSSAFGWFSTQTAPGRRTRAVGMTDVQIVREMTQTFRRLDNRFGGGHARSAVTTYLASDVLPLLRDGRYRDEVRRELSAAVAELNQLAGWMAYDVGDTDSGRRHLRNAMHLCHDIRDDALAGEMLAGMSHQAAFQRSTALATDLARAAKDNAKRAGVPALVSESAVMEAHGLALANDEHGCSAALRESERAFAAAQDRPEWLAYFDGAYLSAKFGHCFRDLGRPAEAERFARRSLDMIDGYDRGRLFNLALLASALADQRKVEEACETGLAAVRLASEVKSVRTVVYLVDLSHRLAPFRAEPEVRTLDEQIGLLVQ